MKNLIAFVGGYAAAWLAIVAAISLVAWGFCPGDWEPFTRFVVLLVGQFPAILAGVCALEAWGD